MSADQVLFREEQQFRQPWLWVLLIVAVAPIPFVFAYGAVQQLVTGQPWGNHPMSNTGVVIVAGLTFLLTVGLLAFFWTARLTTVVRRDGLLVRFRPIHFSPKRIDLSAVASVESVTYSPLSQYGGWGIRYTLTGKAYNVSGNQGVRLTMREGRSLLIGSQRADELAAAVRQIWEPPNGK
jgi:hypothetical protein